MEITLKYQAKLIVADAYMEIKFMRECPDIVRYLENPDSYAYNEALKERIGEYLKDLGIYDTNNELTRLGKAIKKSGKRYRAEYGKYKIAFLYDDKIFGTQIVALERSGIANNNNKEIYKMPFKEDSHFIFELIGDEAKMEQIQLEKKDIHVELVQGKEFFYICRFDSEGDRFMEETLKIDDKVMPIKNTPFFVIENIKRKAYEVLGSSWSGKYYSLSLPEMENNAKDVREFQITKKLDSFIFKDVPCIPYKQEAQQWLEKCLLKDLEDDHITKNDFWEIIDYYFSKTPLGDSLESKPDNKYYDDLIQAIKKENPSVYWHAHATRDLIVEKEIGLKEDMAKPKYSDNNVISYGIKEKVSLQDIADKILAGRKCSYCVYIIKHCREGWQAKRIITLIESFFDGKVSAELIIDRSSISRSIDSEYANSLNSDIRIFDWKEFELNEHDRFIILKVDETCEVWNITNPDFLRFSSHNRNRISKNDKGEVIKKCTISKLPKGIDEFKELVKLKNHIKKVLEDK